MSKRRLPTLKQIAGEHPHCQYCGKELKPVTETVDVTAHINAPPAVDSLLQMPQPKPSYPSTRIAVDRGYKPERVFRMTLKSDYTKTRYTKLHFWTGKDQGYGYTDTPPLFCNNECGRLFGLAAWRVGYRMKGHE
jgi:hypothetical protein